MRMWRREFQKDVLFAAQPPDAPKSAGWHGVVFAGGSWKCACEREGGLSHADSKVTVTPDTCNSCFPSSHVRWGS